MAIGLNTLIMSKWKQAGRTVHHPQHFLLAVQRYCLLVAKLRPRAKQLKWLCAHSELKAALAHACVLAGSGFVCRHVQLLSEEYLPRNTLQYAELCVEEISSEA